MQRHSGTEAPPRKQPRMLCLHGYMQNAAILAHKLRPFGKFAELVFIDGPLRVENLESESESESTPAAVPIAASAATGNRGSSKACGEVEVEVAVAVAVEANTSEMRAWFPLSRSSIFATWNAETTAGLERAARNVAAFIAAEGIDCVLGFSQGATLALHLLRTGAVRRGVLFSPYAIQDDPLLSATTSGSALRGSALVFCGERDDLVPPASSEAAAKQVLSAVVVRHAAGHVIPVNAATKDRVRAFLCEAA